MVIMSCVFINVGLRRTTPNDLPLNLERKNEEQPKIKMVLLLCVPAGGLERVKLHDVRPPTGLVALPLSLFSY